MDKKKEGGKRMDEGKGGCKHEGRERMNGERGWMDGWMIDEEEVDGCID